MRNILVITVLCLLADLSTFAQESTKQLPLKVVEHKIDSLKALKSLLNKKMIEIDSQINYLTELRNKSEPQESSSNKDLFGTVTTDIHMRLTNGKMSDKIRKKSKVLILDYLPDRKSFKVKHNGEIGYLSDSWIESTTEIIEYKRNKKARTTAPSFKSTVKTTRRTSTTSNPISKISRYKAQSDLKASLMKDYGSSYSTIEMPLNAGMEAYDKLSNIPSTQVNNTILNDLMKDYYPHFSTILMLFEANKKSYERLRE